MFRFPFSRFEIKDKSMIPAFRPGERVVSYNWGSLKKGSVVVFDYRGSVYIKRVDKISGNKVFVHGDNKKLSSKIEPLDSKTIIGRVFLKY